MKISQDGFTQVFRFLTNWTWALNTIFWTVDLLVGYALPNSVFRYFSCTLVWFVHGVNWVVFWFVFPLLHDNPDMVMEVTRSTTLTLGQVLIGERVFHVLPTLFTVAWLLLHAREVRMALSDIEFETVTLPQRRHNSNLVLYLVSGLAVPLLYFCTWRLFNDPWEVYGIVLRDAPTAVIVVLTVAAVNGVAFWLLLMSEPVLKTVFDFSVAFLYLTVQLTVAAMWLKNLGSKSFLEHFETWLLTVMFAFVLFALIVTMSKQRTGVRQADILVWTFFWSVNSLAWLLFIFTFVAYTGEALRILDVTGNGSVDGVDFVADRILRVLPVFLVLVAVASCGEEAFSWRRHFSRGRSAIYYGAAGSVLIPLFVVLAYRSLFDPCLIYNNLTYDWLWVLSFVIVVGLIGVGTQLLIVWISEHRPHTRLELKMQQ
jgi:hypothetical protein